MSYRTDKPRIDVKKAVESLTKSRPAYADMLALYGEIFEAQEKLIVSLFSDENRIAVMNSESNAYPLMRPSQFKADVKESDALMLEICQALISLGKETAPDSAKAVMSHVKDERFDSQELYGRFLSADVKHLAAQASAAGVDEEFLGFVVYHSIRPSLYTVAQRAGASLDNTTLLDEGACPVCGSPPAISFHETNGKRTLHCSFCWFAWTARRVFCPFCKNTDSEKLKYFEIEPEKEYRIDVCDNCNNYIKTVDLKECGRIVYPPLENIASLHLDVKAQELGYKNDMASRLGDNSDRQ